MKIAVLVTLGLGLGIALGCSKPVESASPPASTATPAPPIATPPAAPVAPQRASPAAAPKAIASAEGTIPGTRIEVTELKRTSGGTLTLRFTIVNDSTTTLDVQAVQSMLDMSRGYTVSNVHLIDPAGRKKYFTAKDAEGKCVCSIFSFVKPGERFNHWAKFAAPPDDVQKLSVVIPPFAPADDVPISR